MWAIFAAPRILGLIWAGPVGETGLTGRGPDSSAIGLDTPGLWWSRHYGFRPGNSELGSPDTPSRCPDTPGFWVVVLGRGLIVIIKLYLH